MDYTIVATVAIGSVLGFGGLSIALAWWVISRQAKQLDEAIRILASRDYQSFAAGRNVEAKADGVEPEGPAAAELERLRAMMGDNDPHSGS